MADVSGTTVQVQGESGQTAVTYTDTTTFSKQVSATLADVSVGSCVFVTPVMDASSTSGADSSTTVAAGTVRITSAADDGSCTSGFGGGGGERPSGDASDMPTDMPSDMPSGMASDGARPSGGPGGGGGGFGASGEVSAVSETGFTVTQGDQTTEVTVSDDTTYTATADAASDALKAGVCVTARGESDDTGALTAESISISEASDGECTTGFGGGQPGGSQATQ